MFSIGLAMTRWAGWLCFLGLAASGVAQGAPALAQLQAEARAQDLAATRQWQALVHYERDWRGEGVHSTVVTDWFFLAPDGRRDPAAELDAYGEIRVHFGGESERPGKQEERSCPLRERVRIAELTVAPIVESPCQQ